MVIRVQIALTLEPRLVIFFDVGKSHKQTAQKKTSFLALGLLKQTTFENVALYWYI